MDIMDGGRPVARLGDTGAGLGLSVRDPDASSREVLIQDLLERRRQAILERVETYNKNRIADIQAANNRIDGTNGRLEAYNKNRINDIAAVNGRVDSTNSRVEAYNKNRIDDISAVGGRVSSLSSRVESYNSARVSQITALGLEIDRLKIRLSRLEGGGGPSPH